MKKTTSFSNFIKEGGLWANMHARRKAGKPKKKPGQKGYPKTLDIEGTEGYVSNAQRAAVWANRADGGKGHPDNKKKKSKKEAYEPITTKRSQALAKADAEPKKPVTLPKAPWDKKKEKSEMTDNEKTRSMAKANKKVGAYKPAKRPDDEMREGKVGDFVIKKAAPKLGAAASEMGAKKKDVETLRKDVVAKGKKPGATFTQKVVSKASDSKFAKKLTKKTQDSMDEGAMKRMSTGDGMDTYKKKPDEVKKKKPIKLKDRQVKLKNFRLPNNEAFSSRAIVKKPRAGDGKPMSNKPMVRSNSPEHKAAVKKYIGGMKSNRPGTPDSKLPRQMRDPKKDAMVSKGGKVKVVDKNKEADHLKKGYVRAEDTITKELFMKEANMMVTRPGSNAPIKITTDQWPAFKARGYHHAEQKEMNMNTMKLIDRMKKASPAAKKALEAPSRVKSPNVTYDKDGKVVKKVNELTIADVRKATEKAKKRQEKERKATGKTSTSTTDLAARREGKAYGPTGVSYSDEPNLVSKPKPKKDLKAHKVAGRKSGPHKEAVQVDELSKGTMGSYIKKAKSDMGSAEQDVGSAKSKAWMLDKKTNKIGDDAAKRSRKRKAGIDTAVNKLVKTEAVDEEMIKFTEKAKKGLAAKAEKSGMPQSVLRSVYNRGMAAWKTGHRPGTTPQQWAMARVNSFTTKSSGTWGGADKDLAAKVRKEDVNPDCECEDCNCNPCECGEWRADMGPQGGGISTDNAEKLGEAKMKMTCEDCGCQYGNIDPDCDCPNDGSDRQGEHFVAMPMDEALDMKQRLARGRSARKNKAKLSMGRKKAGRRIASMKVLKKRAQRAARKTLTKRLTKGVAKQNLSVARKREIEKKLDTKTFQVKSKRLVKRTIKDIRKKEIARKRK
jgi:hypothetical protein